MPCIDEKSETRQQVFDLLTQTRDLKLLQGDAELVLGRAKEAYELADTLPSPWREVAAYRLAQLLFRRQNKSVPNYGEIDDLLKEAAGNDPMAISPLGPLPWVYRMASLHRLSLADLDNKEDYFEELQLTRKAALRRFFGRIRDSENRSATVPTLSQPQIQSDQFNLLELATYFVDLPYDPLLGISDNEDANFPLRGNWVLISNQLETGTVQYTSDFAHAEQRALLKSQSDSLGFSLPGKNQDGVWVSNRDFDSDPAGTKQLTLLAAVLFRNNLTSASLQGHLGITSDYLRTLKKRLVDELNERAGQKVAKFEPRSFQLLSEIPVIGAVNHAVLRGL